MHDGDDLTSHLQQLTSSCTFLLLVTTSSLSIFSVMYSMSRPARSNAEDEYAAEDGLEDEMVVHEDEGDEVEEDNFDALKRIFLSSWQ